MRRLLPALDLAAAWERHATEFVAWARKPGHDSYWRFHRDLFLPLIPPAGRKTLDLGCGEGRLLRDLKKHGHAVVGIDVSPTMVEAAREADCEIEVHLADAAALPFADEAFDCVVAFMSLQDVGELARAVHEVGRVLQDGGRFCLAIVHPLNSAGLFEAEDPGSPFTITGSYLAESYYADEYTRDGLDITFVSAHRPVQAYAEALADAGFVIERVREPAIPEEAITRPRQRRWQRVPLFLHLRALKLRR